MLSVHQLNQITVFLGRTTLHANEVPAYVALVNAVSAEVKLLSSPPSEAQETDTHPE